MPFPTVPFPSVPLPIWTKPKLSPVKTQAPVKPLNSINEKNSLEIFGLPSPNEPDPFGVLALERAGLEIREAGTKSRPPSDAFEFRPSPTSPIFSTFARHSMQSIDSVSRHNSYRDSKQSTMSIDQGTQTPDFGSPIIEETPESSQGSVSPAKKTTEDLAWISDSEGGDHEDGDHLEEEPDAVIEQASPAVQVLSQSIASPILSRAKLVTIPRRIPPALPPRNPHRTKVERVISEEPEKNDDEEGTEYDHSSRYSSPTRSAFDRDGSVYSNDETMSPNPWEEVALKFPGESPYAEYVMTENGSYITPVNGTQTEPMQADEIHQVNMDAEAEPVQQLERSGTDKTVEQSFENAEIQITIPSQDSLYNSTLPEDSTPIIAQPEPQVTTREVSAEEHHGNTSESNSQTSSAPSAIISHNTETSPQETEKPGTEIDEFHSVPTTPLDPQTPELGVHAKDFA